MEVIDRPQIEGKEVERNGRKYWIITSEDAAIPHGAEIIVGPPEGLVDTLGIPEPFSTKLHNILYDRRIFTYRQISSMRVATAILQDFLSIDAQKLAEAFFNYEKETV